MRSRPSIFDVVPRRILALSALIVILSSIGCAGGVTESESRGPNTDPVSYTVGGAVSGLAGSGLTLQDDGGNNLPISANGSFAFTATLASGSTYGVTVVTQPTSPSQTCVVTSGSGTLTGSNVTSVSVACTTNAYTIGGTVSGLAGSGLTLQDNSGNNLPISANGSFGFTAAVASGSTYSVTVMTQPTSPSQTCVVASGSGTLASTNVTGVSVACTTNAYTVGGTVSGLAGSGLTLQDNGGNNLPISANGSFAFIPPLPNGSTYGVTVMTQPTSPSQTCVVTSGSGTLTGSNVTSVSVACTTNAYTIGGTVSGLAGSGLILQDNSGNNLPISANGSFGFTAAVASGSMYSVTVMTQPTSPSQTCVVTSGSGTLASSNVTGVSVACTTNAYTVGGTVSGLAGSGLILQDNGGNNLPISANGSFAFIAPLPNGSTYGVTVMTQPTSPSQTCVVTSGSGTLTSSNVTSISVACTTNAYTVGGTVSGLAGSGLILQDNGGNNLPISGSGSFGFTAAIASGSTYSVTVMTQPTSPSQTCVVASGSGTLASSNVTGVSVACTTNAYTVGGTVSGLAGSGLTLQDNGGNNLPISANGSFAFIPPLPNGSTYGVTVMTQPTSPSQTCVVTSGSGTLTGSSVTSVSVACTTNAYTIGGTVSGLAGSGLTLQDGGGNNLSIAANGSFVFTTAIADGSAYGVTVLTQPTGQTCGVSSGSGTLTGSNVTSVSISCIAGTNLATVTWTATYQTIDGFGASDAYESLTSSEADLFFSTTNGVGFSLLRTFLPDDGSCTSINSSCAGSVSDMQLAIARGARVWSTPWSPPASMKSNGSTTCSGGSGSGVLNAGSYGAYATYLSNYITSLSTLYGIQLYAVSVQNEPDYCPSYDGALWSDTNFDTFIKNNLGPTLSANGQSRVRIVMPESAHWYGFTGEADTCMTDPGCASYVGINAWHDYDDASSIINPYSASGVGFWETEASAGSGFGPSLCGGCWDPSMADGLLWAGIIDNRMAVSNANAWNYWWLIDRNGDNEGLVNGGVASKRLYVMGNYSRFVRPGWVRIDATHSPVPGVTVSAYKDPVSGNFAIIATNQGASDVDLAFSLSGFTSMSITPWVTSATLNLVQQSSIQGGSTFTATLPASSVTTFTGAGN